MKAITTHKGKRWGCRRCLLTPTLKLWREMRMRPPPLFNEEANLLLFNLLEALISIESHPNSNVESRKTRGGYSEHALPHYALASTYPTRSVKPRATWGGFPYWSCINLGNRDGTAACVVLELNLAISMANNSSCRRTQLWTDDKSRTKDRRHEIVESIV
jgi:hypothetical protein